MKAVPRNNDKNPYRCKAVTEGYQCMWPYAHSGRHQVWGNDNAMEWGYPNAKGESPWNLLSAVRLKKRDG
jgi:hypothetical protein